MTAERWVCKRCFTSVDGSLGACTNCGLIRGSEAPAGQPWAPAAAGQPEAGAAPAPAAPAWQGLLRFWWVPVIVVVAATAWFLNARRDESGQITTGGNMTAADLRIGDCFDLQDETQDLIDNVDAKPCSEPHIYQMFFVGDLPAGDYPGQDTMDEFAFDNCLPAFETYVGVSYQESVLKIFYLTPSEDSWSAGDHSVQCAAHLPNKEPVSQTFQNYRQ